MTKAKTKIRGSKVKDFRASLRLDEYTQDCLNVVTKKKKITISQAFTMAIQYYSTMFNTIKKTNERFRI